MEGEEDEPLRLANGLEVWEVAEVMMRMQEKIERGDLVLVPQIGYVPKWMLGDG